MCILALAFFLGYLSLGTHANTTIDYSHDDGDFDDYGGPGIFLGNYDDYNYNLSNLEHLVKILELLDSLVSNEVRYSMVVVSLVLYSTTCVLRVPGNAFVIWIAGVKMKKSVNTICYVNLALVDLLCCLAVPFFIWVILLEGHFPYGASMCKFLSLVIDLKMFASVFILTLISLNRFTLVTWPAWAQNDRSISRALLLSGLAWLLALLLNLPQLIYSKTMEVNNKTVCYYVIDQSASRAVHSIHITKLVFGFLVPLLLITVCYLLIARRLSVERFKSQKVLRIMVGVATAFFLCWMPRYTVYLVIEYGKMSWAMVARAVLPLVSSLACFNSCVNPVMYMFMDQDFRKRVRVSLCGQVSSGA